MTQLLNALPGALAQGLIWGVMAIGVYITYKVLDIADLTDFAVVAEPYRSDGAIGLIALIGPKRMDYIHSINAVRDGAHALESSL